MREKIQYYGEYEEAYENFVDSKDVWLVPLGSEIEVVDFKWEGRLLVTSEDIEMIRRLTIPIVW